LPELRGFLCDHVALTVEDNVEFHWLFPGDELSSGLRRLVDDKACLYMSDCISEDGVAEIYVETFRLNGGDGEVQGGSQGRTVQDQTRRDIEKVRAFYSSSTKENEKRLSFYSPPSEDDKDGEGEIHHGSFKISRRLCCLRWGQMCHCPR
jgi:hypothetical protein